jgi:hypothetical protein
MWQFSIHKISEQKLWKKPKGQLPRDSSELASWGKVDLFKLSE